MVNPEDRIGEEERKGNNCCDQDQLKSDLHQQYQHKLQELEEHKICREFSTKTSSLATTTTSITTIKENQLVPIGDYALHFNQSILKIERATKREKTIIWCDQDQLKFDLIQQELQELEEHKLLFDHSIMPSSLATTITTPTII